MIWCLEWVEVDGKYGIGMGLVACVGLTLIIGKTTEVMYTITCICVVSPAQEVTQNKMTEEVQSACGTHENILKSRCVYLQVYPIGS